MRISLLCAVIALLGAIQDPSPQQPPPAFKSGVQLVEVDVRVFDRLARAVEPCARHQVIEIEEEDPGLRSRRTGNSSSGW